LRRCDNPAARFLELGSWKIRPNPSMRQARQKIGGQPDIMSSDNDRDKFVKNEVRYID